MTTNRKTFFAPFRPALERLRRLERGDEGYNLTEMLVTLIVIAIAMALAGGLIVGFNQQTTNIGDSVTAVRQTSEAETALVQYLRGATQVLATSPSSANAPVVTNQATNADNLTLYVSEGFNATSTTANGLAPFTAGSSEVCVQWVAGVGPRGDAQFNVTYDCGQSNQRTVATYYAYNAQTFPVFTYYKYAGTDLQALTEPVPACAMNEIVAVGVHVTFLAGPQVPAGGFAADLPTTLDTTVFLHGAGLGTTTTSSSTSTTSTTACPE